MTKKHNQGKINEFEDTMLKCAYHCPGGDSHVKTTRELVRNFDKKRYQDPALWVRLEFLSPLRSTYDTMTHHLLS